MQRVNWPFWEQGFFCCLFLHFSLLFYFSSYSLRINIYLTNKIMCTFYASWRVSFCKKPDKPITYWSVWVWVCPLMCIQAACIFGLNSQFFQFRSSPMKFQCLKELAFLPFSCRFLHDCCFGSRNYHNEW